MIMETLQKLFEEHEPVSVIVAFMAILLAAWLGAWVFAKGRFGKG